MKALVLSALLTLAGVAPAQYPSYNPTQYVAATYATQALYGVGYLPAAPQAQAAGDNEQLKRIEQKLDKLIDLLTKEIGPESGGDAQPAATLPKAFVSGATKCAECHAPAVAKEKGKGFQIFDDQGRFRQDLTPRDLRHLTEEVEGNTMPPPDSRVKLAKDERDELLKFFKAFGQPPAAAQEKKEK